MRLRFDDWTGSEPATLTFTEPREVWKAQRVAEVRPLLEWAERQARAGRWVAGYLTYEAGSAFDPAIAVHPGAQFAGLPLAAFGVFSHPGGHLEPIGGHRVGEWRRQTSRERHAAAVEEIRRRVREGDVYQVNYTVRLRAPFEGDPLSLYLDLVAAQRGAHAAFADLGEVALLSASPEEFLAIEGREVRSRPMKGTRRRGRWSDEDLAIRDALAASEKDRAENLMIVDLVRNDLGKVAEVGSVQVQELFALERYETVWQLTSAVVGELAGGVGLPELLAAAFPPGSVTGAPKVAATRIIAELEDAPRGVYTGTVGWLGPKEGGGLRGSFNVAIRTVAVDRARGEAEYGVGGGITFDSHPSEEVEEAEVKARVLALRRPEFRLLETMRFDPQQGICWLDRHLGRLAASADYFGFPCSEEEVRERLQEAVSGSPRPGRVRLWLDRRGRVEVEVGALPPSSARPVRLAIDPDPVDADEPLLYHKTDLRDRYRLRLARHPGADDVVSVNREGGVGETTIANLVVCLEGGWWTPPVESGLLPGVYRGVLLDEGRIAERPLSVDDLHRAEELAVISALRGWRRAVLSAGSVGCEAPN